jgi:hypothetical protein
MKNFFTFTVQICLFALFLMIGGMFSLHAADRYAVANGNWNSTSTWSKSSGGTSGASVPAAGDNVYIERGYTVTVTANAACSNLYFSTATTGNLGTLTVNSGVSLTVSGGVTLNKVTSANDVWGTISGAGILNCASLNIGNAGNPTNDNSNNTHTLTSTISALNISGDLSINSYFRDTNRIRNGVFVVTSGTVTVSGTVKTSNQNAANTSTLTLGNSSPTLNLAGGTPFTLSGTGTNTITLNGTGATVNYSGGAQTIYASNYHHLTLSGSGNKSLTGTANIQGNFTNNATFTPGTSTFSFVGTSPQTIGGSSSTTFYNLTINNTGTSGNNTVTLEQPTTVTNTLTLTSGIVNTTSTNVLSVTNTGTGAISGGSSTSFVNGPLKRSLPANYSTASSYVFPVGAGNNYYPFTLVNPTTGTTAPTVQIEAKTPCPNGAVSAPLVSKSTTEYWTMNTTGNFTNSSVSLQRPGKDNSHFTSVGGGTSANGPYTSLGGTKVTDGVKNSNLIENNRYFVLASTAFLTLSTNALTGFTYVEGNGPSGIKSFTVNAEGLTNNVVIMAPEHFEVSLNDGTSFSGSSQLTISAVDGAINNVPVYVRMKAGLAQGNFGPEQLTASTTGFTSQTINLSGSVTVRPVITLSPVSLSGFTYVYMSGPSAQQSFTVSGTNLQGNVTLTAPLYYEISTTSSSGFTSTLTLTPTSGTLNGTTIYVRLRAGFGVTTYNENITATSIYAETKTVSLSGSVTAAATLTASPSILSGFIYTYGNGPSASQSFTLKGTNLSSNITVTAPTNFEISNTQNGTYTSSISLSPTNGTVDQTLYARLKSGLAVGSYGLSNITLTATGAVTKTVALSGKVVNTPTLIASPAILGGFSYVVGDGPSSAQSFTVSGASLGTNNISITPTLPYEVSLSANSGYQASLSLTPVNGTVNATTIYVRMKTGITTAGAQNGSVSVAATGATSQTVTLNGQVYSPPSISAGGGGDYCTGSTIQLTSSGENIQSLYWTGPNSFYSTVQNPSIPNSTSAMSGAYTVTGNVVVGGNLISNGDFESGNVGFGSNYGYPSLPFSQSSLQPEGLYAVVKLPSEVHNNFTPNGKDHTSGSGYQMVVNGATNPGRVVWSQSVAVIPNADYEFSYWVQTVVNGNDSNPAQLQLYINGVAMGSIFTANPTTAVWTQYVFNTNAGTNTTLNLEIVNQNTIAGGNDFALDDIVMHQIAKVSSSTNVTVNDYQPVSVSVSYSPSVVYSNTPVTYTATPTNGGSSPVYKWTVNGTVVGSNSPTFTYTPQNGDIVKCELRSSYPCATGNPATASVTMSVLNQYNYWMGSPNSTDWGTASNWTGGYVPLAGSNVEYATVANYGTAAVNDLQLDQDRVIGSLINATNKKLIIPAGKALTVNNTITISDSQNANLIQIKSGGSSTPQGTLIFHNDANHPVYATVEMYSKAWIDPNGVTNNKYFWQYFGIPFRSLPANPSFYGAYVRRWNETGTDITNHWVQLGNSDVIQSFLGYEICQPSAKTYTLQGILENRDFSSGELAYTTTALYPGQHIFGNSYTAAIDITQINFGSNMEATVYLYNTGSYNNWITKNGETSHSSSNTNPGTYAAIPKNQAGQGGVQGQIPSMQGFLVKAMSGSSGKTISIPYSSVAVKNTTLQRAKAVEENDSEEKQYLRIDLKTDTVIVDRMWIFNEENCTRSFDNGWDGPKMLPASGTPALCAIEEDGIYQVNSVNDMNNIRLGFQKGNATNYSLEVYSENLNLLYSSIYLMDEVANKVVDITNAKGMVYTFSATAGESLKERFRIMTYTNENEDTLTEPQIKIFSSKGCILIYNQSSENGEAIIYDIAGRKVGQEKFFGNNMTVLNNYRTGAYVVRAVSNKETVTKRIIVQ